MVRLRFRELRRFAVAAGELAEASPAETSLSNFLLGAMVRLVPLDRVSYNEVDRGPSARLITAHSWNEAPDPSLIGGLNRFMHEHPGFATADPTDPSPPPTLLSDHLSQRQFRRLGLSGSFPDLRHPLPTRGQLRRFSIPANFFRAEPAHAQFLGRGAAAGRAISSTSRGGVAAGTGVGGNC